MSRLIDIYHSIHERVVRIADGLRARLRSLWLWSTKATQTLCDDVIPASIAAVADVAGVPQLLHATVAAALVVALVSEGPALVHAVLGAAWLAAKVALLSWLLDHWSRRLPWHRTGSLRRRVRGLAAVALFWTAVACFALGQAVAPKPAADPATPVPACIARADEEADHVAVPPPVARRNGHGARTVSPDACHAGGLA